MANRMKTLADVTDDVEIDPDKLDEACLAQPRLLWDYGKLHIRAMDRKHALDKKARKLYNKLYIKLAKSEKKLTKDAIKAKVESTESYEDAEEALYAAQTVVNQCALVKEVLGHRKSMLRELVFLVAIGYTGELKMSADMRRFLMESVERKQTGKWVAKIKGKEGMRISEKQSKRLRTKLKIKKSRK